MVCLCSALADITQLFPKKALTFYPSISNMRASHTPCPADTWNWWLLVGWFCFFVTCFHYSFRTLVFKSAQYFVLWKCHDLISFWWAFALFPNYRTARIWTALVSSRLCGLLYVQSDWESFNTDSNRVNIFSLSFLNSSSSESQCFWVVWYQYKNPCKIVSFCWHENQFWFHGGKWLFSYSS